MSKTTPSISRLPCERCGGPVESDNGWFGQRVEEHPKGGLPHGEHPYDYGYPRVVKYAICWKCVSKK